MALELLWAEHEGQRWPLPFSWAWMPGVPGVPIPGAFYGQQVLLALFRDRLSPSPHSPFLALLQSGISHLGALSLPQTLGSSRGPHPSLRPPGAQKGWPPRAEGRKGPDQGLCTCCSSFTMSPPSCHLWQGCSHRLSPLICEGFCWTTTPVRKDLQCPAPGRRILKTGEGTNACGDPLATLCRRGWGSTVQEETAAHAGGQAGHQETRPAFLWAVRGYSGVSQGNLTSLPLRTAKLAPSGAVGQAVQWQDATAACTAACVCPALRHAHPPPTPPQ